MKLSSTQQRIIDTPGNLIVTASAGTGKTHTMVAKITYEIANNHSHKSIAAITFTIKAAQEIKDRLTADTSRHFIGTNNSFAIEEVIKPFLKDVYGFNVDMSTDYSNKVKTFDDGLEQIKKNQLLCSYADDKKDFIFDLALNIVKKSSACRLYLQAKYFKIYIDEYQDCDQFMHSFFMFLCDELHIATFIVGDEKQSIYTWRGADPQAFKSILAKPNFQKIFMKDNFRSCQQIQNYSNLLCKETQILYKPTPSLENIIWITASQNDWAIKVLQYIDSTKRTALLRFKNADAEKGADELSQSGNPFIFIPQLPIANISTETAWLYESIAKYVILEKYSVYNLISRIPSESAQNRKNILKIKSMLDDITKLTTSTREFNQVVEELCSYLGYTTRLDHLKKLHQTIVDTKYRVAFDADQYQNISITVHSSKGLEFEQVILFAQDYKLAEPSSIFKHYVAVTRAKSRVVIVKLDNRCAEIFQTNLSKIFAQNSLQIEDLLTYK